MLLATSCLFEALITNSIGHSKARFSSPSLSDWVWVKCYLGDLLAWLRTRIDLLHRHGPISNLCNCTYASRRYTGTVFYHTCGLRGDPRLHCVAECGGDVVGRPEKKNFFSCWFPDKNSDGRKVYQIRRLSIHLSTVGRAIKSEP